MRKKSKTPVSYRYSDVLDETVGAFVPGRGVSIRSGEALHSLGRSLSTLKAVHQSRDGSLWHQFHVENRGEPEYAVSLSGGTRSLVEFFS